MTPQEIAAALHNQLRDLAAKIKPFPSFMERGWVQAVEVEPDIGMAEDRGCVVVCPDGELYELVLRLLPGAEAVSDPDPTEDLVVLHLTDIEYIGWAQAAVRVLSGLNK